MSKIFGPVSGDRITGPGKWLVASLGTAAAYYLGARLGLVLALVHGQVTPLWPSTGIALACLLFFGARAWPGIAIGAVLVNATLGPSIPAVLAIGAGNTLAPLAAWVLLGRAGFRTDLGRVRDAMALVLLGALASMLISATIGTAALVVGGAIPASAWWSTWTVWWAGDAMGVLVVTPVLLAVRALTRQSWGGWARTAEMGALTLLLAAVAAWALLGRQPVLFLFAPVLVWAAWRFGLAVAAAGVLLSSVSATLAAAGGHAPFVAMTLAERMVTLQAFNGSIVVITLLVVAATSQWRAAQRAVERSAAELEERVRQRTADLAAAVDRLRAGETMLNEAQRLGQVGSWERDLATDQLAWSDELYRLYGLAPQSVKLDYPAFLAFVHPDDLDALAAANDLASREHRPVEIDHRVVWPDGSVHWLHRRATVLFDEDGVPVKMIGTARDITAAKLADDALRRNEAMVRTLLDSVPDAVIGCDRDGRITLANHRTEDLFGYPQAELVGQPVEMLMPQGIRTQHARHRAAFLGDPRTRPMGADLELFARRRDGAEFPVDVALSPVRLPEPGVVVLAAVRDATERRRAEAVTRELRDGQLRRRQALEINDNVVQGLTAALYALDRDDLPGTARTLHDTLRAARAMMHSLIGTTGDITPADLVRHAPADLPGGDRPASPPTTSDREANGIGVVLADDSPHIRFALAAVLESITGVTLLGEATDGAEAVSMVADKHPDVVLLDLSMPVLDGLSALTRILKLRPSTKVIVLSGHAAGHAAQQALDRGAVAYVEKGGSIDELVSLFRRLYPRMDLHRPTRQNGSTLPQPTN